ncbi:unnamed protein product [Rotaria sordida]|uniref:Prohibitin n=1 Tax=Rotaria sordida TaxID=392033 RepID=A0A815W5A0_9BILA|nr:unnamed protein product [Rotaria sordida]CAF1536518.1 unnamed protein product [Rotaria sordida]
MEIIQIHMIFMVQHSSHTLLKQNGFTQQVYLKYKQECLDEKHFRQHVFEDFQQETLCDHEAGQLYGLEKFWTFLKYSRQKPKINPKLEEILKNYKNLEDFRVDGVSFPQQFFPTKSNYKEFSVLRRIGIGLAIVDDVINFDGGHRTVIFYRFQGVKLDVIEEGTHFMISWLHRPIIFDIRTRPRSVPSITEIKDLQTINVTLRILYRPRAELLPKIFYKLGELLIERAAQFGLLLDDISSTHLSFRFEFTSAVELKLVAQQDVGKQRFLVEKVNQ